MHVIVVDGNTVDLTEKVKKDENINKPVNMFCCHVYCKILQRAKSVKLENWKNSNIYREVLYNGKKCVSVRWVFMEMFG